MNSIRQCVTNSPTRHRLLAGESHFGRCIVATLQATRKVSAQRITTHFNAGQLRQVHRRTTPCLRDNTLHSTNKQLTIPPRQFLVSSTIVRTLFRAWQHTRPDRARVLDCSWVFLLVALSELLVWVWMLPLRQFSASSADGLRADVAGVDGTGLAPSCLFRMD